MVCKWLQIPTPLATLILMVPVCLFIWSNQDLQRARRVEHYHHALTQSAYQSATAILAQVKHPAQNIESGNP
jgi:hypothetical protein